MRRRLRAFTLIELLVVIGVIAVLIAILIPSLSRAKQMAVSATCLSNLRQCGIATAMYASDFNNSMPYPTTTLDVPRLWFNAIDPYLQSLANSNRTGVAGERAYTRFKQCPAVYSFLSGNVNYGSAKGAQNTTTESMRSYKMNGLLRHNNPYSQANYLSVPHPANFVLYGDGIAMDTVGAYNTPAGAAQQDNSNFSMDVDTTTGSSSPPSLRHSNGANIAFVDGHAEHELLPLLSPAAPLGNAPNSPIARWQSEYISGGGSPYYPPAGATSLPAGVTRNPNMPLQWSDFSNDLYR